MKTPSRLATLAVLACLTLFACSSAPPDDAGEGATTIERRAPTATAASDGPAREPAPEADIGCVAKRDTCASTCGPTKLCALECTLIYDRCVDACAATRTACWARCGNNLYCSIACTINYRQCTGD